MRLQRDGNRSKAFKDWKLRFAVLVKVVQECSSFCENSGAGLLWHRRLGGGTGSGRCRPRQLGRKRLICLGVLRLFVVPTCNQEVKPPRRLKPSLMPIVPVKIARERGSGRARNVKSCENMEQQERACSHSEKGHEAFSRMVTA